MSQPIWSAPVRYAEVDQQNIVFNAHYLTYCDEASTAYFRAAGLLGFAEGCAWSPRRSPGAGRHDGGTRWR